MSITSGCVFTICKTMCTFVANKIGRAIKGLFEIFRKYSLGKLIKADFAMTVILLSLRSKLLKDDIRYKHFLKIILMKFEKDNTLHT